MITYQEYEKAVYDWLLAKNRLDPTFTFSTRLKAMKGSELDYFIGTEKSGYFGLTFWSIPIQFPGSSADLIDVFFEQKEDGFKFFFEFSQTMSPSNAQNISALNLIKNIKEKIREIREFTYETKDKKMFKYIIGSPKSIYSNLPDLFSDLEKTLNSIKPIVENGINEEKKNNPNFNAQPFSKDQFIEIDKKLKKRFKKYDKELNDNKITNKLSASEKRKIEFENNSLGNKINIPKNLIDMTRNIILYGPPGTGKTYNTVDKAVKIIAPQDYKDGDHEVNKIIYDQLYKSKNVMFTTFHQSMSYEDFIEGIKPKLNDESDSDSEEINYEISSGIFKIACARAAYNAYIENRPKTKKSNSFENVFDAFLEMARNKIVEGNFLTCETITGKEVEIYKVNKNDSIKARSKGSVATHVAPLTKENIQKLYDTFDSVNEIKSLQQIKETVGVSPRLTEFYAVFKSILNFKETQFEPIKDEELVEKELSDEEVVRQFDSGLYDKAEKSFGKEATPVVLIIDEINRGNVSAIFGELITLIEEDKRIGQKNEIRLTLPYSKNEFSVPPNLYIIGTMNTADRSVEALDTALRRRFTFEEMLPQPELIASNGKATNGIVNNINLVELLNTINERIEALLDRDHTIGHSYFMEVDSLDELRKVFANKVIPLLQEYFYGDYVKMEMVIGPDFFNNEKRKKKVTFAIQNDDVEIPIENYTLMNILDPTFNFDSAINRLLNRKVIEVEAN